MQTQASIVAVLLCIFVFLHGIEIDRPLSGLADQAYADIADSINQGTSRWCGNDARVM